MFSSSAPRPSDQVCAATDACQSARFRGTLPLLGVLAGHPIMFLRRGKLHLIKTQHPSFRPCDPSMQCCCHVSRRRTKKLIGDIKQCRVIMKCHNCLKFSTRSRNFQFLSSQALASAQSPTRKLLTVCMWTHQLKIKFVIVEAQRFRKKHILANLCEAM